ncbi:MAG: hypothetical protein WDW38_007326 [Sanguina aurantia]
MCLHSQTSRPGQTGVPPTTSADMPGNDGGARRWERKRWRGNHGQHDHTDSLPQQPCGSPAAASHLRRATEGSFGRAVTREPIAGCGGRAARTQLPNGNWPADVSPLANKQAGTDRRAPDDQRGHARQRRRCAPVGAQAVARQPRSTRPHGQPTAAAMWLACSGIAPPEGDGGPGQTGVPPTTSADMPGNDGGARRWERKRWRGNHGQHDHTDSLPQQPCGSPAAASHLRRATEGSFGRAVTREPIAGCGGRAARTQLPNGNWPADVSPLANKQAGTDRRAPDDQRGHARQRRRCAPVGAQAVARQPRSTRPHGQPTAAAMWLACSGIAPPEGDGGPGQTGVPPTTSADMPGNDGGARRWERKRWRGNHGQHDHTDSLPQQPCGSPAAASHLRRATEGSFGRAVTREPIAGCGGRAARTQLPNGNWPADVSPLANKQAGTDRRAPDDQRGHARQRRRCAPVGAQAVARQPRSTRPHGQPTAAAMWLACSGIAPPEGDGGPGQTGVPPTTSADMPGNDGGARRWERKRWRGNHGQHDHTDSLPQQPCGSPAAASHLRRATEGLTPVPGQTGVPPTTSADMPGNDGGARRWERKRWRGNHGQHDHTDSLPQQPCGSPAAASHLRRATEGSFGRAVTREPIAGCGGRAARTQLPNGNWPADVSPLANKQAGTDRRAPDDQRGHARQRRRCAPVGAQAVARQPRSTRPHGQPTAAAMWLACSGIAPPEGDGGPGQTGVPPTTSADMPGNDGGARRWERKRWRGNHGQHDHTDSLPQQPCGSPAAASHLRRATEGSFGRAVTREPTAGCGGRAARTQLPNGNWPADVSPLANKQAGTDRRAPDDQRGHARQRRRCAPVGAQAVARQPRSTRPHGQPTAAAMWLACSGIAPPEGDGGPGQTGVPPTTSADMPGNDGGARRWERKRWRGNHGQHDHTDSLPQQPCGSPAAASHLRRATEGSFGRAVTREPTAGCGGRAARTQLPNGNWPADVSPLANKQAGTDRRAPDDQRGHARQRRRCAPVGAQAVARQPRSTRPHGQPTAAAMWLACSGIAPPEGDGGPGQTGVPPTTSADMPGNDGGARRWERKRWRGNHGQHDHTDSLPQQPCGSPAAASHLRRATEGSFGRAVTREPTAGCGGRAARTQLPNGNWPADVSPLANKQAGTDRRAPDDQRGHARQRRRCAPVGAQAVARQPRSTRPHGQPTAAAMWLACSGIAPPEGDGGPGQTGVPPTTSADMPGNDGGARAGGSASGGAATTVNTTTRTAYRSSHVARLQRHRTSGGRRRPAVAGARGGHSYPTATGRRMCLHSQTSRPGQTGVPPTTSADMPGNDGGARRWERKRWRGNHGQHDHTDSLPQQPCGSPAAASHLRRATEGSFGRAVTREPTAGCGGRAARTQLPNGNWPADVSPLANKQAGTDRRAPDDQRGHARQRRRCAPVGAQAVARQPRSTRPHGQPTAAAMWLACSGIAPPEGDGGPGQTGVPPTTSADMPGNDGGARRWERKRWRGNHGQHDHTDSLPQQPCGSPAAASHLRRATEGSFGRAVTREPTAGCGGRAARTQLPNGNWPADVSPLANKQAGTDRRAPDDQRGHARQRRRCAPVGAQAVARQPRSTRPHGQPTAAAMWLACSGIAPPEGDGGPGQTGVPPTTSADMPGNDGGARRWERKRWRGNHGQHDHTDSLPQQPCGSPAAASHLRRATEGSFGRAVTREPTAGCGGRAARTQLPNGNWPADVSPLANKQAGTDRRAPDDQRGHARQRRRCAPVGAQAVARQPRSTRPHGQPTAAAMWLACSGIAPPEGDGGPGQTGVPPTTSADMPGNDGGARRWERKRWRGNHGQHDHTDSLPQQPCGSPAAASHLRRATEAGCGGRAARTQLPNGNWPADVSPLANKQAGTDRRAPDDQRGHARQRRRCAPVASASGGAATTVNTTTRTAYRSSHVAHLQRHRTSGGRRRVRHRPGQTGVPPTTTADMPGNDGGARRWRASGGAATTVNTTTRTAYRSSHVAHLQRHRTSGGRRRPAVAGARRGQGYPTAAGRQMCVLHSQTSRPGQTGVPPTTSADMPGNDGGARRWRRKRWRGNHGQHDHTDSLPQAAMLLTCRGIAPPEGDGGSDIGRDKQVCPPRTCPATTAVRAGGDASGGAATTADTTTRTAYRSSHVAHLQRHRTTGGRRRVRHRCHILEPSTADTSFPAACAPC